LSSNAPQTLAWEPLDSLHILACSRIAVASVLNLIVPHKQKWLDQLAEAPNECCRSHANIDIEAWYSTPAEKAKGQPDIYKFYCNECGDCHVKFCVGGNHPLSKHFTPAQRPELFDIRPMWEAR
jgi:hypothetical protein